MQLYVMNSAYEIIGVIDEADSVLWHKKYNEEGYCEIYIGCNAEMLELLKKGNYVYRYDDDMFCKISSEEIETDAENGDFIIATAKDICTILAGRIVRLQIVYSGTVGGFIQKVLRDNVINPVDNRGNAIKSRRIDNFALAFNAADFPEPIEVSAFTEDLLQLIITTCKTANLGFRVSYDLTAGQLRFRLFRGKNKASMGAEEYIEFSPAYGNILSTHYKTDDSNYKNIVYVGYKDTADAVHLLSRYKGQAKGLAEPEGEARREFYVDGTGTSRDITIEELEQMFGTLASGSLKKTQSGTDGEKTLFTYTAGQNSVATSEQTTKQENGGTITEEKITVTDYTYMLLIQTIADNALAEQVETEEFSGSVDTIDTYEYKQDYDIGDTVMVKNDYGISATAQIVDVLESDDNEDGHNVEPTFEFKN